MDTTMGLREVAITTPETYPYPQLLTEKHTNLRKEVTDTPMMMNNQKKGQKAKEAIPTNTATTPRTTSTSKASEAILKPIDTTSTTTAQAQINLRKNNSPPLK